MLFGVMIFLFTRLDQPFNPSPTGISTDSVTVPQALLLLLASVSRIVPAVVDGLWLSSPGWAKIATFLLVLDP